MEKERINKIFEKWAADEVEIAFGIVETDHSVLLEKWLSAKIDLEDYEQKMLENLRKLLVAKAETWKEQELIIHFIAPLITLAQLDGNGFSGFALRKVSADVGDYTLSGKPDYFLAAGSSRPRQPYFCIHEYKYSRRGENDPRGQLLAEMLVAQKLNGSDMPILGAYIVERNWFFVVLDGKQYTVSREYVGTQSADIVQIMSCLRFVKEWVEAHITTKGPNAPVGAGK